MVGISMGGMVAFELAVRYPGLLKGLVVVNSVPEMQVNTPREHLGKLQRLLVMDWLGARQLARRLSRRLFPRPEQASSRRTFVERRAQNDKAAYTAKMPGAKRAVIQDARHAVWKSRRSSTGC